MEINKITFENSNLGISQSFDDLDVNNDGVISEKDAKATQNSNLSSIINNVLDNVDDDAEIVNNTKTSASNSAEKTSASTNKYGILQTDSDNFENDVTNSKGTVYVVMGNLSGCGYCITLANAMSKRLDELNKVATCYNIEWNKNSKLCWDIYNQAGKSGSVTFPQIAKFVDGKFVELIDNPRNASAAIESMLEKAEGTPGTNNNTTTEESDTNSAENEAKISELNKKLDEINAELEKLNTQLSTYQKEKVDLETEKAEAEEEVKKANAELEAQQKQLDIYTKQYETYQKEIEDVNKEVLKEENREEDEFNASMNTLVNQTINDYDSSKDGDFNAYFMKKMNNANFPTFSKLESLNSKAQTLSSDAKAVLSNIVSQSQIVANAKNRLNIANTNLTDVTSRLDAKNTQISELQSQISTKEAEKSTISKEVNNLKTGGSNTGSGLTAAEVLSQISDEEKQILKDEGIALTDCIVAQGADGKFHIYKHSEKEDADYYISIARWYGDDDGYDLVADGSGFVTDLKDAADGEGRAIYTFSEVNDDLTDGTATEKAGCYETCSPLSFDVNGNGIKTTNETVSFDIDGDGKLDTVNNSDEWVLAFDKDKDGIAGENGSELFGDNTDLDGDGKADGFKDGFAALKALAEKENLISNGDTKLDANDIKILSDKYGLTMTNGYGGEAKSLSDLGISEINLADTDETTLTKNFDGKNNDIMTQEGATFVVNGETHNYADIWNAKKDSSEAVDINETKTVKAKTVEDKFVDLHINKDGIIALKGDVNFDSIKNKAIDNANIPSNIFSEIVEVKKDEEE